MGRRQAERDERASRAAVGARGGCADREPPRSPRTHARDPSTDPGSRAGQPPVRRGDAPDAARRRCSRAEGRRVGRDGRSHHGPGPAGDLGLVGCPPRPTLPRRAARPRGGLGRRRGLRARGGPRARGQEGGGAPTRDPRDTADEGPGAAERVRRRRDRGRALPTHPPPGRRLRRDPQGRASRPPRGVRRSSGRCARGARLRVRRVHRVPPRAMPPAPNGARTPGRAHRADRQASIRAPRPRGPPGLPARGHGWGGECPRTGRRSPPPRRPGAVADGVATRLRVDRVGRDRLRHRDPRDDGRACS